MTFEEKLAQYRQAYGLERNKIEGSATAPTTPKVEWADDVTVAEETKKEKVSFDESVEVPTEVLSPYAPGLSGNPKENIGAFEKALDETPAFSENFADMEALVEELINQMSDPENPMTLEEAQQEFLKRMTDNYATKFGG